MKDIKKFLNQTPTTVAHNEDGSEYIPIAHQEETLDNFDSWGTREFVFFTSNIGREIYVHASALLVIVDNGVERTMVGAVSFPYKFNNPNKNLAATALSYCVSNALIRMGKIGGRALNKRMEKGETATPEVAETPEEKEVAKKTDEEYNALKQLITEAATPKIAQELLDKSNFRYTIELKDIIKSKQNGQSKDN